LTSQESGETIGPSFVVAILLKALIAQALGKRVTHRDIASVQELRHG
jgi:hypothetical protein